MPHCHDRLLCATCFERHDAYAKYDDKYLIDTAIQNIEGKITMKEAQSLIDSYYEERL